MQRKENKTLKAAGVGLLAWISCIADAQPIQNYVDHFEAAGLCVKLTESHDDSLLEMVKQVRTKLLGAEIVLGLKEAGLTRRRSGRGQANGPRRTIGDPAGQFRIRGYLRRQGLLA